MDLLRFCRDSARHRRRNGRDLIQAMGERLLLATGVHRRVLTLDRRELVGERLIRLFLCAFLAPKLRVPRRPLAPTTERNPLRGSISTASSPTFHQGAELSTVSPPPITGPASRKLLAAPAACSEIALHARCVSGLQISGPPPPFRRFSRTLVTCAFPCAVRTDPRLRSYYSGASPYTLPGSSPISTRLAPFRRARPPSPGPADLGGSGAPSSRWLHPR